MKIEEFIAKVKKASVFDESPFYYVGVGGMHYHIDNGGDIIYEYELDKDGLTRINYIPLPDTVDTIMDAELAFYEIDIIREFDQQIKSIVAFNYEKDKKFYKWHFHKAVYAVRVLEGEEILNYIKRDNYNNFRRAIYSGR